jgi:sodium-dependent phosphate cotransporter
MSPMVRASVQGRQEGGRNSSRQRALRAIGALLLLFVFLVGLRALSTAFQGLGTEIATNIFSAVTNPFVALAVGVLATAIVQSSSISTSMIVTFAAVPGTALPMDTAIVMVMGANIGTTVTNSLVSLGFVGRRQEFSRALAAATCHDIFNLLVVALLLPLELLTGLLSRLSGGLADLVQPLAWGFELPNPIGAATKACVHPIEHGLVAIMPSKEWAHATLLVLAGVMIYVSVLTITWALRAVTTSMKVVVLKSLDEHPALNMATGAVATAIIQSSSVTTSVLVPLAASGLTKLRHTFALTLGANVGTTLTAMLAALAAPRQTAELAVQVATAHLIFNLIGVLLVYPFPKIRAIPMALAEKLAAFLSRSRRHALIYVLTTFYLLPMIVIVLSRLA